MVKAIESFDEFKALTSGSEPVIIDFWATWCGPCKMISPHFAKLEEKFPKLKFAKVDIEEQDEIAKDQGIRVMPTFNIYQDGKVIKTVSGAVPAKLTAAIEEVSNSL